MSKLSFTPYHVEQNAKADLTLKSLLSEEAPHFSILGYPDDEGIKLNGGKSGAALGPESIRKALYKMTPTSDMTSLKIKDMGNLNFKGSSLAERHIFSSDEVLKNLDQSRVISFGGGHDYGYVDGRAFLKNCKKKGSENKPLILNFDAHFDLRNLDKGLSSGTPFFRLIEEFKDSFELFEIGIQKQCNSSSLFDYANNKKNITTLHYDQLYPEHKFNFEYFKQSVEAFTIEKQDCFLSIDIDGFSSAFAPGCSQSWPTGFDMNSFFKMFDYICERFNVHIMGIYEVSPPLDHTELTSRLAALITYRFLELHSGDHQYA